MPLYVLPAKNKEIKNYILLAKIIGRMSKMMRGEIAQNYNTRTTHRSLLLCTKTYYTFFNVLRHVIII